MNDNDYEKWQQWRWKKLQKKVDNCKNDLFKVYVQDLIQHKNKIHQRDNLYQLIDLASSEIDNTSDTNKDNINNLIQATSLFIEGNHPEIDYPKSMRNYCEALDHRVLPDWLQKMIGIVLIIMTVALIAAAIALAISLTGGTVGALIAALVKPIIDVLAASCVGAFFATATGLTATTATTVSLVGAGAIVASWTGMGSYCSMYKPYTDCVEKIITANSKAANN